MNLALGDSCPNKWELKKIGSLSHKPNVLTTDFIFLNQNSVLVVNFPEKGKIFAPMFIYSLDPFRVDEIQSKDLPLSQHPRKLVSDDLNGDGKDEILIADHGTDEAPFEGYHPIILKSENGKWSEDKTTRDLAKDMVFNLVALPFAEKMKGIFKVSFNAKTPPYLISDGGRWKDQSHIIPKELYPGGVCMMTGVTADFDKDGRDELLLGGCDMNKANPKQTNDRILSFRNGKWEFENIFSLPPRKLDSTWGTVHLSTGDINSDNKPDILYATHDYGFHDWRVGAYLNVSTKNKIKFVDVDSNILPEKSTEGFAYAVEEIRIGSSIGVLVEVRSVIRAKDKKFPEQFTRFGIYKDKKIIDKSHCLPELVQKTSFHLKAFPNDKGKFLLIPYHGDAYTLRALP